MSEHAQSWFSRFVAHRIPLVASIAVGSMALAAATFTGQPLGPDFKPTALSSSASSKVFYADPNPVSVCNGDAVATTLYWNIAKTKQYKLFKDAAKDPFAQGFGSGSRQVSDASIGTVYRLESYVGRIQTVRSGSRTVRTTVWVKDVSKTLTIELDPATDCAPIIHPVPGPTSKPRVGQLVSSPSGQDQGTIYLVGDDGLISFLSMSVFNSWCFKISEVVPENKAEMGLPHVGQLSTPRQPGQLLPPGVSVLLVSTCSATPPPQDPPRVTCGPNPQAAKVGEQVTFTANGGVGSYTWSSTGATPATASGPNYTLSYAAAGNKDVTVSSGNQTATCQVAVTEVVTPPVSTLSCTANPATAKIGDWITPAGTNGIYPSYVFDAPEGFTKSGQNGTTLVTYSTAGTKTITVISGGQRATCSVTITGSATPPPAPENRVPVSMVDTAACDQNLIKGWAADPDTLSDATVVHLLDNGVIVKNEPTNIQRDDVNTYLASQYNAGHPVTGAHGFSFDLTPIRADEKVHLFTMELVDNTGAVVKINMGNMASFVCQAATSPHASLTMSYKQITLLDKHDTSIVITDPTGRDDTTVTYKEDTITVGDTMDICPGPDGTIGRRKNVALTGWISPNGGSIFVKDSVTGQEKWFATHVGPTTQSNLWTALLGPGNTAITYTFRVSNYYSGANTLLTKTVTVRPITGPCDPGEYTMTYFLDSVPYCPRNNQYTRAYATATLENVSSQPPLGAADAIVVKFRPFGKADVPENWQVLPVEVKRSYTNDPHYFVISILPFTMQEKGTYDFFLKFRGKTIHQVSKEYFVGLPSPFCE